MAGAVGAILLLSLCCVCTALAADFNLACPSYDPSTCILAKPGQPECFNDSQCPSSKKCCCYKCGWRCVDPVKVRPGSCPNIRIKCDSKQIKNRCDNDGCCKKGEKCCPFCGTQCWKADPAPVGVCTSGGKLLCPSIQCSRGSDCEESGKCCTSADGEKCLTMAPDQ